MTRRCVVCVEKPEAAEGYALCNRCGVSRNNLGSYPTEGELARWAAARARKFERARARKGTR